MKYLKIRWIAVLLLAVGTSFFFGFKSGNGCSFRVAKNLDIFNSIVKELDMLHVDTIDPDKTVRTGIESMLYSLDPYIQYFPEDDQSELEQTLRNSHDGIGSIITWNTKLKWSMIAEPYESIPTATIDLKVGDILMEIDGKDLAGKNNQEANGMFRGQVGTSFKLKVRCPGMEQPLESDIVRRSAQLPFIPYYAMPNNNIGYINLSTFFGNPSKEFKQAFLDLKKQGVTSLVINLRNNDGDLSDEVVEIANFFLPRGKTPVTTGGKIKQASNTHKTLREPPDLEIPLAILVNSATASASEILAGALQDHDRVVMVGNRTFRKGLMQTTRPLPHSGTMKLITSKYCIPSGRCVQAIDYKHRNEDGNVGRIPGSPTTVFRTAARCEVRDGGGVTLDITVKQDRLSNILFYLMNNNLIFNCTTEHCLKHPMVPEPKDFEITDADYVDFKITVRKADFKYNQQTEKILKDLKEMAEFEGYLADASGEFEASKKRLFHNLEHDLGHFSKDIKEMIAVEIIKHYYYQRGSVIQQLKDDDNLKEAAKILTTLEEYRKMLGTPLAKSGESKR